MSSAARFSLYLGCLAAAMSLGACTSQDDDVDLPIDATRMRGGIFEAQMQRSSSTSDWIFMFGSGYADERNPDRLIGYRTDPVPRLECAGIDAGAATRGHSEYLVGVFTPSPGDVGNTPRVADVHWYDRHLVEIEPEPVEDEEEDEDAEPPEPIFELRQRARRDTLTLSVFPQSGIYGDFPGSGGNEAGTVSGSYLPRWYERPSGGSRLAGTWYNDRYTNVEEMRIEAGGGFGADDICGCEYQGHFDSLDPRYNLYIFQLDSVSCGEGEDADNQLKDGRAYGLATIVPLPVNAPPGTRQRLVAVAQSRDQSRVYAFDIERAVEPAN